MTSAGNRSEYSLLTSGDASAIAIMRVRGPAVERFFAGHLRARNPIGIEAWRPGQVVRAELLDHGQPIDDILIAIHAGPPGWDVRLHLHGSPWLARRCGELLAAAGFTQRDETISTLWTSRSTIEAEALALLPKMLTLAGAQWLTRQVDLMTTELTRLLEANAPLAERQADCRAVAARRDIIDWFARSLRVALVGPPNAGKSTLVNALAQQAVSIVSATPGTTRDWLEAPSEAAGYPVTWMDTAGLREAADGLEAAGVQATQRLAQAADALVLVLDGARPPAGQLAELEARLGNRRPACVALNKCDLQQTSSAAHAASTRGCVHVSALRAMGLPGLIAALFEGVGRQSTALALPAAFTDRQANHLNAAGNAASPRQFQQELRRCLQG